tara:strand:- start:861 stop:2261 length:1401 start_codon:yes stop_codon:yes gene_type:complete
MNKIILASLLTICISPAWGNVNSDLDNYFDKLGMMSNTTAPHAYQGQQAGYYSGGSLYARSSVKNVQLIDIELPSFRSGCGGIDAFAGGFSFVKREEIVDLARNVMNNSAGYAFTLALEQVTPQLANTMKYIQDMANKANQMNINSCETAEGLVGGIWPKTRAAQQKVCQDVGASNGMFKDYAESRQGCTSDDLNYNFDTTMEAGMKNPAYRNLVLDNGNLVWKALTANHFVSGDAEMAELLMSLSGTIIIKKTGAGKTAVNHFEILSSLAKDNSLFKAILNGDTATIYKCDETVLCLNPTQQKITVSPQSALKGRVAKLLSTIGQKIIDDRPLSDQEIGLIQSTRIPIYKILNVQAAYQKDPNILDIESYADIIAADILFQYLQENLDIVRVSARSLQYPAEIMAQFTDGINTAISDVRAEERNAQNKISMAMQLVEQTQVLEQMLAGQLSAQLGSSLTWARSLH